MESQQEVKAHGGKRPGAGRKKLDPHSETTGMTARISKEQKAIYEAVGGAKWLRYELDRLIAQRDTGGP